MPNLVAGTGNVNTGEAGARQSATGGPPHLTI